MLSIIFVVLVISSTISASKDLTFYEIKSRILHEYYHEIDVQIARQLEFRSPDDLSPFALLAWNFTPFINILKYNFDPIILLQYFLDNSDDLFLALAWGLFNAVYLILASPAIEKGLDSFLDNLNIKQVDLFGIHIVENYKKYILTQLATYKGRKDELFFKAQLCFRLKICPLMAIIRRRMTNGGNLEGLDLMQDLYPFQLLLSHDPFTFLIVEICKFERLFATEGQASFEKILILTSFINQSRCLSFGLDWLGTQHPKIVMYFFFFSFYKARLFQLTTIFYNRDPRPKFKLRALEQFSSKFSVRMRGEFSDPSLSQWLEDRLSIIKLLIKLNK
jgi:hypothetical protein